MLNLFIRFSNRLALFVLHLQSSDGLLSAHAVQNHFQLYVFLSIFAIYSHLFLSHLYIFISIIFINNFNNLLSLLINFKVIDFSINSTSYMPPKMANNTILCHITHTKLHHHIKFWGQLPTIVFILKSCCCFFFCSNKLNK